ncbi:MAG: YbbR-like domain-containing protein [Acutalibacteraceae bacterium]
MKNKTGFFERLLFNNKFLLIFSFLLAIALWTTVKVNFSDNSARTINDITISSKILNSKEGDYVAFVDKDSLVFNVEVSGKSYDISSSSFSKDNIIIEASPVYVDSVGYKTVSLTARTNVSGVSVLSINPSQITVFYDIYREREINVVAKLDKEISELATGEYLAGEPVASMNTVHVSGPATVVDKIKNVFFVSSVDEDDLPLSSTKEITAKISYDVDSEKGKKFVKCIDVDNKNNPATITIPVYKSKTVPVTVSFINEPEQFKNNPPNITITPSEVKIKYSAQEDDEDYKELNCGTIDFRNLSNSVNKFTFKLDDAKSALIVGEDKTFQVTIDLSSYSKKTIEETSFGVVLLNQVDGYNYTVDLNSSGLKDVVVIGPKNSIDNIKSDDLQIEINVSQLDLDKTSAQNVNVSNISFVNKKYDDCWVYGRYTAKVTVSKK